MMDQNFIARSELPEEAHVYLLMDRVDSTTWNIVVLDAFCAAEYDWSVTVANASQASDLRASLKRAYQLMKDLKGKTMPELRLQQFQTAQSAREFFKGLKGFGFYWFYNRPNDADALQVFASRL